MRLFLFVSAVSMGCGSSMAARPHAVDEAATPPTAPSRDSSGQQSGRPSEGDVWVDAPLGNWQVVYESYVRSELTDPDAAPVGTHMERTPRGTYMAMIPADGAVQIVLSEETYQQWVAEDRVPPATVSSPLDIHTLSQWTTVQLARERVRLFRILQYPAPTRVTVTGSIEISWSRSDEQGDRGLGYSATLFLGPQGTGSGRLRLHFEDGRVHEVEVTGAAD